MNIQEAAVVLAKIQAYDNRKVADANVAAWAEALGNVQLDHALTAVTKYFTKTREWCMPSDIIAGSRDAAIDARKESARRELADLLKRQELGETVDPDAIRELSQTVTARKALY